MLGSILQADSYLSSDVSGSDILCLGLYIKRIGKDKLIGEVKDSVANFLEGQRDGGC